ARQLVHVSGAARYLARPRVAACDSARSGRPWSAAPWKMKRGRDRGSRRAAFRGGRQNIAQEADVDRLRDVDVEAGGGGPRAIFRLSVFKQRPQKNGRAASPANAAQTRL